MSRSYRPLRFVTCSALLAAVALAQATSRPGTDTAKTGLPTIEQLIAALKSKESAAKSIVMELETVANFPSPAPGIPNRSLRTKGSLRVLGKTHVHVKMNADFGDGMVGENETVKTPEGVWTREQDPVQGTVYTYMRPELLAKLEVAMAALGEGHEVAGVPNRIDETKGSVMLESFAKTFKLSVVEKVDLDEVFVIKGIPIENAPKRVQNDLPDPDEIEIRVRERDGMIARMVQRKGETRILDVKVTSLELNRDLDAASFRIAAPEGVKFVDAMDHPPMKEQIEKVLKDAGMKEPAKKDAEKK